MDKYDLHDVHTANTAAQMLRDRDMIAKSCGTAIITECNFHDDNEVTEFVMRNHPVKQAMTQSDWRMMQK